MNFIHESSFRQIYYKCDVKEISSCVRKHSFTKESVSSLFEGIKLSAHPHVHWITHNNNLQKITLQVDGRKIGCYVAKRRHASFQMKMLECTIKVIFESIMKKVRDVLEANPNIVVDVDVATAFDRRAIELYKLWDKSKPILPDAQATIKKIEENYGIPFSEQCDIMIKTMAAVRNAIVEMRAIVKKETIIEEWQKWEEIFRKFIVHNREQFHVKVLMPEFDLSQEDREFLGLSANSVLKGMEKMSCYSFAFLKAREKQAIDWIKSCADVKDLRENYILFLRKWGYELQVPPKEGDLILKPGDLVGYVNTSEDADSASGPGLNHLAVLLSSGEALSKMGFTESAISLHRLSDVPGQFGRHILFFRKVT